MTDQYTTFVGAARALAVQYPPAWSLPEAATGYALPDREIAAYFRLATTVEALRAARSIVSDRLEAIESGAYYETRGHGSDERRFMLDRAEAYHRLWWIDVFIAVHTHPAGGGVNETLEYTDMASTTGQSGNAVSYE